MRINNQGLCSDARIQRMSPRRNVTLISETLPVPGGELSGADLGGWCPCCSQSQLLCRVGMWTVRSSQLLSLPGERASIIQKFKNVLANIKNKKKNSVKFILITHFI